MHVFVVHPSRQGVESNILAYSAPASSDSVSRRGWAFRPCQSYFIRSIPKVMRETEGGIIHLGVVGKRGPVAGEASLRLILAVLVELALLIFELLLSLLGKMGDLTF